MAVQVTKQRPQKQHETNKGRDASKCAEVEPASTDTPSGQKTAQKRYDRNYSESHREEVQEKNDEVLNDIDELLDEIEESEHMTVEEMANRGHITLEAIRLQERTLDVSALMLSHYQEFEIAS